MADEAALLRRIRECDTAALAQVYDDYYDRIYRYVYSYLGQVAAAEDLTANVFRRLLGSVRKGNSPRTNLSAWLYRVAHNLVVDTFRRQPGEELELAEWLESHEPDLTHTVEQHLQMERVRIALQQLTQGQQQVIVLKFLRGMDSREVATILDKTEGAIDALQHRALLALRKALAQQPGPGAPPAPEQGEAHKPADTASTEDQLRTPSMYEKLFAVLSSCIVTVGALHAARTGRRIGRHGLRPLGPVPPQRSTAEPTPSTGKASLAREIARSCAA